jgi:hypothetical protein
MLWLFRPHRAYGDNTPCILYLRNRYKWVVSFMLQQLYLEEQSSKNHWIGGWTDPRHRLTVLVKIKIIVTVRIELQHFSLQLVTLQLSYMSSSSPVLLTSWSGILPQKLIAVQTVRKFPTSMQLKGSHQCLLGPDTEPCPQLGQSTQCPHILLL